MKRYINKWIIIFLLVFSIAACEDMLDVNVYSELTPEESSDEIVLATLYNAYANARLPFWSGGIFRYYGAEMPAGYTWNEGGAVANRFNQLRTYTWASTHSDMSSSWNVCYEAIRDANILLDGIEEDSDFRKQVMAESKFIRGFMYSYLHNWFGQVPLRLSSTDDPYLGKASIEEIWQWIEKDLSEAAEVLPLNPAEKGRATKGAALGILCKHYLNTHQWQKCVDLSQEIMNMDKYGLESNYKDIFAIANEGNQEILWALPRTSTGAQGNNGGGEYINSLTFPTDYPLLSNQQVYAAQTYYIDEFIDMFEEGDERKDMFVTEYTSKNGQHKVLYGNDKSMSLKYEFDPNAVGVSNSNDQPEIRYSDILLSRAEALNELNGPNSESVSLINLVRERAGAVPYILGDFGSKEALRSTILKEREMEFWGEGKMREDQIRQGVLISRAKARGHNAQPYHVVFPIPLAEVNANPSMVQNEGY